MNLENPLIMYFIFSPYALYFVGFFSLIISSFLNVVIIRLPIMIIKQSTIAAKTHLHIDLNEEDMKPFNLMFPASHCIQCKQKVKWYHNIPIFSYLFLQGQCAYCHQRYAIRYILIECLYPLCSIILFYYFQQSPLLFIGYWLFFTALFILFFIDIDHMLLPDEITLSFIWIGLLFNILSHETVLIHAILGAIIGYVFLWLVYQIFLLITGKEGLGYGDFKLMSMIGAWLGYQAIFPIIFISSLLGICFSLMLIARKKMDKNTPFAFGPWIIIATVIYFIFTVHLSLSFQILPFRL